MLISEEINMQIALKVKEGLLLLSLLLYLPINLADMKTIQKIDD